MTSRDDLPPHETDLGPQRVEFSASMRNQLARVFLGLVCCGFGVVVLVIFVIRLHEGHLKRGWGEALLLMVLCGACGVAILRGIRTGGQTRIEVYMDGLVLLEPEDETSCRWADIVTVTEKKRPVAAFGLFLIRLLTN